MTGVGAYCVMGCFVHVDVRPTILSSHNACLESRDRLQKNLRLSGPLRDACRLSGNVDNPATHPVNIFTLTDVLARNSIARFLQNHNQVHLFVRADCNSNEFD